MLNWKLFYKIVELSYYYHTLVMIWFAKPADRNNYDEVITGEAEALDILTFVKEHMENG